MAGDENPTERSEIMKEFENAISGLKSNELQGVLQKLLAAGASRMDAFEGMDAFERPAPPSQRRPRRADVVTYRVRVDLKHTKPPLWRRLELASDLSLDEVHDAVQAAFGWTDSHLHRFGSGPPFSRDTEPYLCPFEVEEREQGVPEEEVRLDEVLVEAGDRLFYDYDFGDGWEHVITLEAVSPHDASAPRALCTDGRRPGPAEDCGGVGGYELIVATTDPAHAEHAEAVAEFARVFGDDIDPATIGTTPFDLDAINEELTEIGLNTPPSDAGLPRPLDELVRAISATRNRRRLRQLLNDAGVGNPVEVSDEAAARRTSSYDWLLNHVGDDGIALTAAGYLPPTHVEAVAAVLDPDDRLPGKKNREDLTPEILIFRESAQKLRLLRKYRGRLLLTPRGRALRDDPVALWWHIAEQMPITSKNPSEAQAGLLALTAVAADVEGRIDAFVAESLDALGWMTADYEPLTADYAARAWRDTRTVLRYLGGLTGRYVLDERATPDGVTFARAALTTWPTSARKG